jgi:hypothetical protein
MRILLLNQCFYPDVVATAQHLTDLAIALTERGHEVTVLTSRRGYDDPAKRFSARKRWRGIAIIRIPSLAFGKTGKWWRCVDFAAYLLICFGRLLLLRRHDLTVALTSPPLISVLGALFAKLRGGRFCFWVMDLNPDEGIELGWVRQKSPVARMLQAVLKFSLRCSDRVIALDRFMRDRIIAKGTAAERVSVIPPWSHDQEVRYDPAGREAFRRAHGLAQKFVVMYSGNHRACHPLETLLEAALRLRDRRDISFCFVGGGSEYQKVKDFARVNSLSNILCLPYQPLSQLSGSLSAADLHVVIMGDRFRGLVHPCKVYNVAAIGAPFLYIGPEESHVADLSRRHPRGLNIRAARHGAPEQVTAHIEAAAAAGASRATPTPELAACFSRHTLLPQLIAVLEQAAQSSAALPARGAVRRTPATSSRET